jgi:hypothetical protein
MNLSNQAVIHNERFEPINGATYNGSEGIDFHDITNPGTQTWGIIFLPNGNYIVVDTTNHLPEEEFAEFNMVETTKRPIDYRRSSASKGYHYAAEETTSLQVPKNDFECEYFRMPDSTTTSSIVTFNNGGKFSGVYNNCWGSRYNKNQKKKKVT